MRFDPETGLKRCSSCMVHMDKSLFYANNRKSDGLQTRCKRCQDAATLASRLKTGYKHRPNKESSRLSTRKWKMNNPEKYRISQQNTDFRRHYGISLEYYNSMLAEQGGRCAICGSQAGKRRLSVDHDHTTNEIRGLLCTDCNFGLGILVDSIEHINIIISYLEKFHA